MYTYILTYYPRATNKIGGGWGVTGALSLGPR